MAVPTARLAALNMLALQRSAGNAAVNSLVVSRVAGKAGCACGAEDKDESGGECACGTMQRQTDPSGPPGSPVQPRVPPTTALSPPAPSPVIAPSGPPPAMPGAVPRAEAPAAVDITTDVPAGTAPLAGSTAYPPGDAGPLDFVATVSASRPSVAGEQLVAGAQTGALQLEAGRQEATLPAVPEPTGMDPGEAARPPDIPEIQEIPPSAPEGGDAIDPAGADRWADAGSEALGRSVASLATPVPDVTSGLRPVVEPGQPLAATPLPGAAPLPSAGPNPSAAADEAGILDAAMGPSFHAAIGPVAVAARSAGTAFRTEVSLARQPAATGIAELQGETTRRQQAAAVAAQDEVGRLHEQWGADRTAVVDEQRSAIRTESGQTRAAATATITAAESQAKDASDQASQSSNAENQAPTGLWGRITAVGGRIAGALRDVASSVVSVVAGILAAARQRVGALIQGLANSVRQRIAATVQALRARARQVWTSIGAALRRAQEVMSRLAAAAVARARQIWAAAKERLARAWTAVQRAASAAVNAVRAVVAKAAAALRTLRQILMILRSGALERLFQAVHDQDQLTAPVIAKAAPLAGQVPAKAEEQVQQKAADAGGAAAAPQLQRLTVQRDPVTVGSLAAQARPITGDEAGQLLLEGQIRQAPTPVPPAPAGEGFWAGVGRHMAAAGRHFLDNWMSTLRNVVWSILTFYPVLLQEGPRLWEECKATITGGGGVDRFDHVLGVLRHLVNIIAGLVATTGVWALIIGAFTGPGEVIVVGAYEAISLAVIAADIQLGLVEMGKAAYSATRTGIAPATRERYLSMFTSSGISTAITIVLVALGAIASRLAKAFKRVGPEVGDEAAGAARSAAPEGPGERPGAGPGADEHPEGPVGPAGAGRTPHSIGESDPARARQLVDEQLRQGERPQEASGHEVYDTREGCVVCSDPCDFMGGKFADKFTHGPRAGEFTQRFQQMEATADPAAREAAERQLVTDLEAEPDPLPGGGGQVSPGAQATAQRLGVDMTNLELDPRSAGRVFRQKGTGGYKADEIRLGDQIAGQEGSDVILPVDRDEAAVDGFLRGSGRPVQMKTLEAAPKNQPNKMVVRANEAYASAQEHGWANVDLHIEASGMTTADAIARWNATGRVPSLKPMPGGHIGRVRVHCSDGIVDLPVPAGAPSPPPAPIQAPAPVPSGRGGAAGPGTGGMP